MSELTDGIVENLQDAYQDAVAELSIGDAIEVTESLRSSLQAALWGLQEDAKA